MDLIILPGNSLSNKQWAESLKSSLKSHFDSIYIQNYHHWGTDEKFLNLEYELNTLADFTSNFKDYIIFAKSVGVILALKAISDKKLKKLKPSKCIFAGMAFSWAKLQNIDLNSLFKNYEVPTLFIQNSNDPAIPFHQLTEFLTQTQIKSYQITKFSGNEHKYDDIEKLSNLISQYS